MYDIAHRWKSRIGRRRLIAVTPLVVLLVGGLLVGLIGPVQQSQAALLIGDGGPEIFFGRDDDNINNPIIQPPGVAANQSLNNTDVLISNTGNDVLVGLLGSDVMHSGTGNDILIGGTEQGVAPNSDIMFGDVGNDISIWAPGDGSDLFVGGPGVDAEVFGVIDRDNNIPRSAGPAPGFAHIPSANVTGMNGFCTVERVSDPSLGYEFLVRFFVRTTGNLAVTIRLVETEQVFCASQAGGQITFADLTQANPQFVPVTLADVQLVNPTVARIIR